MKRITSRIIFSFLVAVFSLPWAARGQTEELPRGTDVVQSPTPAQQTAPPLDPEKELDKLLPVLRIAESRDPNGAQEAFQRVREVLGVVLQIDPSNPRARYYEGRMLMIGGQSNLAVSRLQEWIRSPQGENDWEGHFLLGKIYTRMEFYKLAKPRLEEAIKLNPGEAGPFELLARCETKLANHDGALDAATRYVEALEAKDAMNAEASLILADAYILNQNFGKAAQAAQYGQKIAMQRIRELGGSIPTLTMVERCIQKGQEIVQAILELQPNDPTPHYQMSLLLREQAEIGNLRALHAALAWNFRAMELSGERPHQDLFVSAGELLVRVGKPDEALKILNRGREIHPTHQKITDLYNRLDAAMKEMESQPSGGASPDGTGPSNTMGGTPAPAVSVQPPQ